MARGSKAPVIIEGVRIEKVAAEGKCIGYLPDEKVVFVPFTAPGDIVDIRLGRRRKSYAEGVVHQMVEPSPHRVEPRCEHFGVCGGCKWQHLPYALQLESKEQQVYDQLERIGKLSIQEKRAIIGANHIYEYRNKLEYAFSNKRWLTENEVQTEEEYNDPQVISGLGFHIPGRFDKVLDIHQCHLQVDVTNRIRRFVKSYCLTHEGYPFFNVRTKEGFMRNLMVRTTQDGKVMLVVIFGEDQEELRNNLLEAIKNEFPEITSLMYVINEKLNDTYGDLEVHLYAGEDHVWEEMEGLKYKIGPKSFYQTNSEQALRLYQEVRKLAQLSGGELVYDLYTGTGTIASFISRNARKVIGIEYVPEAIEDAWVNARVNNLDNVDFYAGDMKEILTDEFIAEHGVPDVLITDPPRAGMHPDVVKTILKASPEKIVYVSCNPASQARDVALMSDAYEVLVAQPVDMFPHTHHVENILLLSKLN